MSTDRLAAFLLGTLRRRFTLGVALVVLLATGGFVWQVTLLERSTLLQRQSQSAEGLARTLAASAAGALSARDLAGLQELVMAQQHQPLLRYAMLLDAQGLVLAHTERQRIGQHVLDLPAQAETADLSRSADLVDVVSPALLGQHQVGWARIGIDGSALAADMDSSLRRGLLLALTAAGVAAVAALFIGGWLTRRLAVIQQAADAVEAGDHARRATLSGSDEAVHLARAFNRMLDSLALSRQALAASEQRLLLALEAAALVPWQRDLRQGVTVWGHDPQALLGPAPPGGHADAQHMVVADDRVACANAERAAIAGQGDYAVEFRLRRTDGQVRWHAAQGRVLRDAQGTALSMIGVTQDISDRRAAEAALADSEQRWLGAIEASGLGVWDWNVRDGTVFFSPRWRALLGLDQAPLSDGLHEWSDRVHPDDLAGCLADLHRHMGGQGLYRHEYRMRAGDGSWRWVLDRGQVFAHDADGQVLRMVGTLADISERKALDAELKQHRDHLEDLVDERTAELEAARQESERLARVKTDFLAHMSHEIRTPLNAVIGLAQVGERGGSAGDALAAFRHIRQAGDHLLLVINDVLDFSRLQAGKVAVEAKPFRLREAVDDACRLVAAAAQDKGLQLHTEVAPDVPDWVRGDALRLRQILLNLLANAVKFTEHGAVRLDVSQRDRQTCFRVSDSGIGMHADALTRLFLPFEQADSSTTRRYGGSGLGLAISHALALSMDGTLTACSTPGQGSAFLLCLPLAAVDAGQAAVQPAPGVAAPAGAQRLQGFRLLAAEDQEVNRMVLQAMLAFEGAQVEFAENGQQALDLLQQRGADAFDAVLMDVQMPVMDGLQATRALRALAPALPVVGLTAHALDEERQRCQAAGMVAHVTKPLQLEVLVATLLALRPGTPA